MQPVRIWMNDAVGPRLITGLPLDASDGELTSAGVVIGSLIPVPFECVVRRAKQRGKRSEHSYLNAHGQTLEITFIGLIDVISLEASDEDEAYYSLRRMAKPARHVRADEDLSIVLLESKTIGSSWWAVPKALGNTTRKGRTLPGRRP